MPKPPLLKQLAPADLRRRIAVARCPPGRSTDVAPPHVVTRTGGLSSGGDSSKNAVRLVSAEENNDTVDSGETSASDESTEQTTSDVVPQNEVVPQNQDDADYLKELGVGSGTVPPPPQPGIAPLPTPPQNGSLPSLEAPAMPRLPANSTGVRRGPEPSATTGP